MRPVIVAFPVYNRPRLLERVLKSWSRVRGVHDAIFEFHVEPGCDESVQLCEAMDFAEHTVHVNDVRLGHAYNVLKSMTWAFTTTDYAIQALDDFTVSTDILELHNWHRAGFEHDHTVLAMTSGRDVPASPVPDLAAVWRCQLIGALSGFHLRKWGMLANRWAEGEANWWGWVNEKWLQSGPRYEVLFPALSRADDIGDHHDSSCFVPDPPPQAYYEVSWARERAIGYQRYVEVLRNAD